MSDLELQVTDEQAAELAALANCATPGPWRRSNKCRSRVCEVADFGRTVARCTRTVGNSNEECANAHFIEAACNLATALLADHTALLERCKRTEERAAIAEKAVEAVGIAAGYLGDDGGIVEWAYREAHAALALPEQAAPASAGTEGGE